MYINKSVDKVIEDNMMVFAQYVIKNRALPDLYSGIKPIHLKILWSMLENKTFNFTKSANVSGKVMVYSPHGDCYETIVNMAQTDRHAYNLIIGQGNFGMFDSRDLKYASGRYTECKLSPLALDCLEGIDKNMVDMIPNYDNTKLMPKYLPVKFPLILCMANNGMAVGMANDMPSFNLKEVCDATISEIKGEEYEDLIPDFANKGLLINNKKEISKINNTGLGKINLRAKYHVEGNSIIITEIPYHKKVSIEVIVDRIVDLVKEGKLKEVTDVLDQTGLEGLNIEISFKKGTDANKLMEKLYKLTPLETSFSCNMNVLLNKSPKVLGVRSIIKEWLKFRRECVKRGLEFDINKLEGELHLLHGLKNILLNIDKAIDIIRNSEDVIENLKNTFNIDDSQSNYIANSKLKTINKKSIEDKLKSIKDLENKLQYLYSCNNAEGIDNLIINDLEETKKKFGRERLTQIIELSEIKTNELDFIEDYNCRIIYTKNYIKKHLQQSNNHKIKEGESIIADIQTTNASNLLIFTNKCNRYKLAVNDLETYKPSVLGDYIYNVLDMDKDEHIIKIVSIPKDYKKESYILFTYSSGKIAKININSFMGNNKKLVNCYNTEAELLDIAYITKDVDVFMLSNEGKALILNTSRINPKGSRTTQGTTGIKLNEGYKCIAGIIGVTKDYNFKLTTQKNKIKEYMLDDIVSSENERRLFDYIYGRNGNQGNFLINTRTNNDIISKFEIL